MSHSKRNTSLAFFTAHERDELKSTWGSRSTRLTRESFLPFGSCQLCLLPSRDPVSCPSHGHVFCRECAVSNLLAQNKELKRLRKEAEKRKLEAEEDKQLDDIERKGKELEDFERVQIGLKGKSSELASRTNSRGTNGYATAKQEAEYGMAGVKRKLQSDDDEVSGQKERQERKRKRRESDRPNEELPSFWVPGKIPDNQKADVKTIGHHPICPAAAADKLHDFSLKSLVTVNFTVDKPSHDPKAPTRTCPSCNKALSNSTKAVLGKPCGHVLCKPCSDKFQILVLKSPGAEDGDDTIRCYICSEDVTPGRKRKKKSKKAGDDGKPKEESIELGLVELSTEGTGFAGGGNNMVKRAGVAFQC